MAALLANTAMDELSSVGRKIGSQRIRPDKGQPFFLTLYNMAALLANTAVDELSSVGRKIYHNALNRRQLPYIKQHGCTLGTH